MGKKIITIGRLFYNLLFAIFVIIGVYIFITIYTGGIPKFMGYSFLRVISTSMEPVINQDDMIIVKETSPEELAPGDIITFYSRDPYLKGFLNTHRIVEIIPEGEESHETEYVTRGDANAGEDYYNAWDSMVVGKYQATIPGGYFLVKMIYLLQNNVVYFVVMVLPILICFIHSIYVVAKIILDIQGETDESVEEDSDKIE